MSERASQHQMISTSNMLTPVEVSERSFGVARKGFSPNEVRSFLRRVADSLGAAQEREKDLVAQVERLEVRLDEPVELDERQLLDALGAETSRVLRSAQDAADAIRAKAEERAGRIVREAQEEAQRLRETTERLVAEQRKSAEDVAAEIRETSERDARETSERAATEAADMRATAERDAESALNEARTTGREMVAEARTVRERILTDLTQRRNELEAHLEAMKAERERLLEAHRVVQRAVAEATDALSGGSGADPADMSEVPDVPTFVDSPALPPRKTATEPPADGSVPEDSARLNGNGDSARADSAKEDTAASDRTGEEEHETGKGVRAYVKGALGLGAREDHGAEDAEEGGEGEADEESGRSADAIFAELRKSETPGAVTSEDAASQPEVDANEAEGTGDDAVVAPKAVVDPAAAFLATRDEALSAQRGELASALKRQLRDDQNDLLDALRKKRGKLRSEKLLPSEADVRSTWMAVVATPVAAAYAAGRGEDADAPDGLVEDLAVRPHVPLRERLATTIDDESADADEIVERIRARYREWKSQPVDDWVEEALATAYAQGIYDSVEEGTMLRWIVDPSGACGPDCEDNALEPTPAGQEFPTGHTHPPAFPGCRCVAAPADAVETQSRGAAVTVGS